MAHHCDALVVCCIDFRFQQYIRRFTDQKLAGKTFDLVGFAGATKYLDNILGQIDISVKLHKIKEVYLMHHQDCGAYGDQDSLKRHRADLIKAKQAILKHHPHLKVFMYYLTLDGQFQPITD